MFDATVSEDGSVCKIELAGEFDLDGFERATATFDESLSNGHSALEIDLRALTFIDSTGLRALLYATNRAQEQGTTLTIIQGGPQLRRVFEIAGVADRLPFADA